MSAEELKIRGELEMDVERELEAELKDEIYRLGLRLHRLYQQQKERELAREYLSEPAGTKNQQGMKNKALSEVNINIKMEGGTKIEIKETKKEARENIDHKPKPVTSRLEENMSRTRSSKLSGENTRRNLVAASSKKFDWAKTLRSGAGNVDFHQAKALKSGRLWDENVQTDGVGKNCATALGQRKGKKLWS